MEANNEAFSSALQQLLDAPLHVTLRMLGASGELPALPQDIATARQMLEHPEPPIELLDALFLSAQSTTTVTRSVADVMQLAALAVGVTRCNVEVPPDERPQMCKLYDMAIGLPWIEEEIKELLDDGFVALTSFDENAARAVATKTGAAADPKVLESAEESAELPGEPEPHRVTLHEAIEEAQQKRAVAETFTPPREWIQITGRQVAALFILSIAAVSLLRLGPSEPDYAFQFDGCIESVQGRRITGWAWNRGNPMQPVRVELTDGVNLSVIVVANVSRSDLEFAGPGTRNHGFVYELPRRASAISGPVTAKIVGSNYKLVFRVPTVASAK